MGQDVLCVLQSFRHFRIVAVKGLVERHSRSLALLIDIGHVSVLRVEQYFSVILEVNLDDFVAESEHDGMLGPHPFLDVHGAWRILQLVGLVHLVSLDQLLLFLWIVVLLEVRLEVLKQCDFLLKLLRVAGEVVLLHHVLLLVGCDCFALVVVELRAAGLGDDLRRIVEEDACGHVGEKIAEAVLGRVVNPLGYPHLRSLINRGCLPRRLRSLQNCILVDFQRLLSDLLPGRCAFLGHSLDVFRRSGSHGRNRWHLRRLLLRLHLSLVRNLRHLVALRILSLSAVNAWSVGVHRWITLCHRSLSTVQSSRT